MLTQRGQLIFRVDPSSIRERSVTINEHLFELIEVCVKR